MAQIKALLELDSEISGEIRDLWSGKQPADANEPRLLEDLELAIIAGGDSIPCW